jgi:ureidoacrylate peracid hydrolase
MKALFYSLITLALPVASAISAFATRKVILLQTLEQQINPGITALLIIDMQNDYVADEGKVGKLGMDVKKNQAAVPTMNRLIKEARKAGVMIVWIRQTHSMRDALPNYLASNFARKKSGQFKEDDFLVQEGSWGAEYFDKMAKRLPAEIEVIKHTYGGFTNTALDTFLKTKGIQSIISMGCLTNACVSSTAMQGWLQGYYSIIPSDASSSNDTSLHEATLKNHRIFYGYTPKTEEIVNIWKKIAK